MPTNHHLTQGCWSVGTCAVARSAHVPAVLLRPRGHGCALLATKDHVNLVRYDFLHDPTVPDPDGIIDQGHGNAAARARAVETGDRQDGPGLT